MKTANARDCRWYLIVVIGDSPCVSSLRSYQGITFFPRMFFLLFCLFHIYYFANPYGFAYTALVVNGLFMWHSMVFFWHRYELPAVALGRVTVDRPRLQWDDGRSTMGESAFQSPPPRQPPQDEPSPPPSPPINRRTHHQQEQEQQQQKFLARHASFSSHNSSSRNSAGIFREDDEEDLMYILQGEVVVRRERSTLGTTEQNETNEENTHNDELPSPQLYPRQATFPTTPDRELVYSGEDSKSGLQSILEVRLTPRHSNETHRPRMSPPSLPVLPS